MTEIPDNVKNQLEIIPVRWIDKVLEVALVNPLTPLPDEAPAAEPVVAKVAEAGSSVDPVIKH